MHLESCSLGRERKLGGMIHLRLNTNSSPIANKYREGKVQSTLERELNVPETAVMQAYGTCAWSGGCVWPGDQRVRRSASALCCARCLHWCRAPHPPAVANTGSCTVNYLLPFTLRGECSSVDCARTASCGRALSLGSCSGSVDAPTGRGDFVKEYCQVGAPRCVGLQGVI